MTVFWVKFHQHPLPINIRIKGLYSGEIVGNREINCRLFADILTASKIARNDPWRYRIDRYVNGPEHLGVYCDPAIFEPASEGSLSTDASNALLWRCCGKFSGLMRRL